MSVSMPRSTRNSSASWTVASARSGTRRQATARRSSSASGPIWPRAIPPYTQPQMAGQPSAAVLTIGNELVSGDVENTNGSWLATRLERLGVAVQLIAAVPDDVDRVASFVRTNAPTFDVLIVTGGLGGTPDDVT